MFYHSVFLFIDSCKEEAASHLLELHLHQRGDERAVRDDADVGRLRDALRVVRGDDKRRPVAFRQDRLDVSADNLQRRKR